MEKIKNLMMVRWILTAIVAVTMLTACSKKGDVKPIDPPVTNAKIVGKWQIDANAKEFDETTSTWNDVHLKTDYTDAIWNFLKGTTKGAYTVDHATGNNFTTNDGSWSLDSSNNVTIVNNTTGVTEFIGIITFAADGKSFMIQGMRKGSKTQITWNKVN